MSHHRSATAVFLASICLSALFVAGADAAPTPTPPYKRTIVVGGGTPAENGAALIAAVGSIPPTNPNNRWLIHLEPGEFALGPVTLTLRNFVDLEGSGRGLTTLSSTSTVNVAVLLQQASEVRDLTIQSRAAANIAGGVMLTNSSARLTRVDVDVEGQSAIGVFVQDAAPRLDDVAVAVRATAGSAFGFQFANSALVGRRLSARVEGVTQADGLVVFWASAQGTTRVEGLFVRVTQTGSTGSATGLLVVAGEALVDHADIEASSPLGFGAVSNGLLTLEDSRVVTANANGASVLSNATARIQRSFVQGVVAALAPGVGVLRIENSRIQGQKVGNPRCVGSYDGAFMALDANCH